MDRGIIFDVADNQQHCAAQNEYDLSGANEAASRPIRLPILAQFPAIAAYDLPLVCGTMTTWRNPPGGIMPLCQCIDTDKWLVSFKRETRLFVQLGPGNDPGKICNTWSTIRSIMRSESTNNGAVAHILDPVKLETYRICLPVRAYLRLSLVKAKLERDDAVAPAQNFLRKLRRLPVLLSSPLNVWSKMGARLSENACRRSPYQ
jgi:hypothetical protein